MPEPEANPAQSEQQAGPADSPAAWFYLEPETSHTLGPFDAYGLAGLLDSGAITVSTLVWAEGQENWVQLQQCAQLYAQVYYISSVGASTPCPGQKGTVQTTGSVAAESAAAVGKPVRKDGPMKGARPAILAKPVQVDRQLAEFQADLAALGAEPETGTGQVNSDAEIQRAETPPPDDREFEDDDGTVYVWDPMLRKFQARDNGQPGTKLPYAVEEMTFEVEEETIPTYDPPSEVSLNSDAEENEELNGRPEDYHGYEDTIVTKASTSTPATSAPAQAPGMGAKVGKGTKRGAEEVMDRIAEKQKRAKEQAEAQKQWFDLKVNTSVYVTGLPDDITEVQLAERFSQYGVLKPGEDGVPRVKIYKDKATGMPKGDGLVTYMYQPSVDLAVKLANDDLFRPDMAKRMAVQPAKFEMHGSQYVPKKKANKKKSAKQKALEAQKVLGWGGFDDKLKASQVTVILKNLFHPDDFIEEPTLLKDLEADILEECTKIGRVDKVRVFAGNVEGVVSVKFKAEELAQECIKAMHGRFFGGRKVEATMWDGLTNYNVRLQETPEHEAARRERFAREIEAQQVQEDLQVAQEQSLNESAALSAAAANEGGDRA